VTVAVDDSEPQNQEAFVNNSTGKFYVGLPEALEAGARVKARQSVRRGEQEADSEFSTPVPVVPEVPSPVLEQPLFSGEGEVSGSASAGASVQVRVNNRERGAPGATDKTGTFKVKLAEPLRDGERVEVQQTVGQDKSPWSTAAQVRDQCPSNFPDCRDDFEASGYAGLSLDTFAAGELKRVLNQEDSGDVRERLVAGIDFGYRLWGTAREPARPWKPQLWVFGETVHGARSSDLDCPAENQSGGQSLLDVCDPFDVTLLSDRTILILRNSTSLEAFAGFRYEFLTLHPRGLSPANLYWKSQGGFLTVAQGASDVVDAHTYGALGAVATRGKFQDSYLEVGFGRTDLFANKSKDRWKLDGFVTWEAPFLSSYLKLYPFVQMTVDADFGGGSDSVQTYLGFEFDIDELFRSKREKEAEVVPTAGGTTE